MSTTLTNGLKLPDKGSVDWYADMQNNYAILDGAVGTIAEHTSQIAGKAPLVHTHTKSDVTDLFNSDNTWSGSNSFNSGLTINNAALISAVLQNAVKGNVSTAGDFAIFIKDKVNGNAATSLLAVYRGGQDSGGSYAQINIDTKGNDNNRYNNGIFFRINPADNSNNAVFIPQRDKTIDLGTSLNQWKSVCAESYYYNGVAWGLDKVNTWSAQQKIVGNNSRGTISIYNPAYTKGSTLSSTDLSVGSIYMGDDGQQGLANSLSFISTDLAAYGAKTLLSLSAIENTASSRTRTNVVIQYDKNDAENPKKVAMGGTVLPTTDATFLLGTSSFRWKTLNGVNPGALGLPSRNYDPIDTRGWDLTGATGQSYTPTVNGWLFISIQNIAGNYLSIVAGRGAVSVDGTGAQTGLRAMLPVIANESVAITVKTGGIFAARFYPMQGNVS